MLTNYLTHSLTHSLHYSKLGLRFVKKSFGQNFKTAVSLRSCFLLAGILFNSLSVIGQTLPQPSQWAFTQLTGFGYSPQNVAAIPNNTCLINLPNNQTFYPPVQRMTRCNPDISKQVSIRPQFTSGVSIPIHFNGVPHLTSTKYRFKTSVYTTVGTLESLMQTNYNQFETIGPFQVLNQADLNKHPAITYWLQSEHDVRLVIEVQENRPKNFFSIEWVTMATLHTCKSEVRNQNGAPGFEILNTTFNNTTWPQHFQNCVSNIRIQTQNSCNNGFNLLVAEVDQNYTRTEMLDASRWFSNIKNREVNLQLFSQGIGEFQNNTFETQPFIMTGGNVSTNANGATGTRYFMIVVGTLEPNWATSVKLVKMLNCKADSLNPGEIEIYDEDQIKEEFPEMLEAFNAYRKDYLKVFPNPSQNAPHIQLETSLFHGAVQKVFALDPMGNRYEMEYHLEVEMGEIAQYQIHLQPLRRGVYTLIVVYENGHTATEKLIH